MEQRRSWRQWIVWWLCISLAWWPLAGCNTAPPAPDTVHLAAVILDEARLAKPEEYGAVRIARGGAWLKVTPRMVLRKGDRLETGPNATAVIRWPGTGDGYLRPNGRLVLGSAFLEELTDFFARVQGLFAVETTNTRSAVRGTAFRVRALAGGPVEVTVYEGTVDVGSTRGAWAPVAITAGSMGMAFPGAPRPMQVPADELRRTQEWAQRIEKLVAQAGSEGGGRTAGIVASIAAVIAVLLLSRDDKKPPPPPTGSTPNAPPPQTTPPPAGTTTPGRLPSATTAPPPRPALPASAPPPGPIVR